MTAGGAPFAVTAVGSGALSVLLAATAGHDSTAEELPAAGQEAKGLV